jgi:hypothetical protein
MATMILVRNTRPRLHSIPVNGYKTLQLSPGINQVPADAWKAAELSVSVKRSIDSGALEVKRPSEGGKPVDGDNQLKTLSVVKALRLVADTFDERLLKAWRNVETRKPVQEALDAQYAEMQAMLLKDVAAPAQG